MSLRVFGWSKKDKKRRKKEEKSTLRKLLSMTDNNGAKNVVTLQRISERLYRGCRKEGYPPLIHPLSTVV